MLSFWVVKEFDIVEDILPSMLAGGIGFPSDAFPLQELEETLCNRIIIAITSSTHAGFQIMSK